METVGEGAMGEIVIVGPPVGKRVPYALRQFRVYVIGVSITSDGPDQGLEVSAVPDPYRPPLIVHPNAVTKNTYS
jgi:hypothetical protein